LSYKQLESLNLNKDKTIIVTCTTKKKYINEMNKFASNCGYFYVNITDFKEYHFTYSRFAESKKYLKNKNLIDNVSKKLNDQLSKKIYSEIISFYFGNELNFPSITSSDSKFQYIDTTVPLKKKYKSIVNCGAYDGEVYKRFKKKYSDAYYFLIEPDLYNFNKLKNLKKSKKTSLFCLALSRKPSIQIIETGLLTNSSIINEKTYNGTYNFTPSMSLDSLFYNFNIGFDFINFDIEGSELNALQGSKKTFVKYKPDIAISIYHKVEHLWKIPLFINSLLPNKKLFIRNYSGLPSETILYCVK